VDCQLGKSGKNVGNLGQMWQICSSKPKVGILRGIVRVANNYISQAQDAPWAVRREACNMFWNFLFYIIFSDFSENI
jgi:hypothetical protein